MRAFGLAAQRDAMTSSTSDLSARDLAARELTAKQRELLMLRLKRQRAGGAAVAAPPGVERIPKADRSRPLPLSFAQQRLWFLDRLDAAASAAYHVPAALRLSGRLDLAALQAALNRIVERHEALRTRFAWTDDGAVQVIDAAAPVPI